MPDVGGGGGFKSNVSYHLEGLIPIILIIVIAFFAASYFGVINSSTPGLGPIAALLPAKEKPASVLYIGEPSRYTREVLANNRSIVYPITYRNVDALSRNARQQLPQFDIVVLDQSQQANKEITNELGDALNGWVSTGGKLITVKDSATRVKGDYAVIGWKAALKDLIPADCAPVGISEQPSCTVKLSVAGRIFPGAFGWNHQIMKPAQYGYPSDPNVLWRGEILDVTFIGNEVAYIEDARTKKQYTAISEKPSVLGKSLYFNYDPGTTPELFLETLKYLSNK